MIKISKYKKIFAKVYVPNWSWTYVISDVKVRKLLEHFTKKNYKKRIKRV